MRMVLLIGAVIGTYAIWPYIEADEQMMWAAMLPAAYFAGMWALFDGSS